MKVAIVRSGISGMCSGYFLSQEHEVTVYEKNSYIGGHTNTLDVDDHGKTLAVDTGFIVFNKKTYPNFVSLIEHLGIPYHPTSMSFSVSCATSGLEYNGTSLNRLFAQRTNLMRPSFYRFIQGILRFNEAAKRFLEEEDNPQTTLGEFVRRANVSDHVVSHYLIPMAAAVWSADPAKMWNFPAIFILNFWKNHGFLEVNDRPQWYVITGGSREYIRRLTAPFADKIRLNTPVQAVTRQGGRVQVTTADRREEFDRIIFACHSDQTARLLQDKSDAEAAALQTLPYQRNVAVLHTDTSVLPRAKLAHAAWNYYLPANQSDMATVHYHMNILQGLQASDTYLVSLNPEQTIDSARIIREIEYHHPVFTPNGMDGQKSLRELSGQNNTFFAGAYMRYGFHEDGVLSALHACKRLGVKQVA